MTVLAVMGVWSGSVRQHVLDQHVDHRGQVRLRDRHPGRLRCRPHLPCAALFLGQRQPEADPFDDDTVEVRGGGRSTADLPARLLDDGAELPLQPCHRLQHPPRLGGVGQRLGLQHQGGDRSAQPVREVRGRLPLARHQMRDAARKMVEGLAHHAEFGRSFRAYAGGQITGTQAGGGRDEPVHRLHDGPPQPLGEEYRGQGQHDEPRDDGPTDDEQGVPLTRCLDRHGDPRGPVVTRMGRHHGHPARPAPRRPGLRACVRPGPQHARCALAVDLARPHRHDNARLGHLFLGDGGDQRLVTGLVVVHRTGHDLRVHLREVVHVGQVAVPYVENERRREQQQAHEGAESGQQSEPPPHGGGSTSLIPTPRTVCRKRGAAAVSPRCRRSQERWTATVLSVQG